MRLHVLQQPVDNKSVASCQQACSKLIVRTCYPQACCKLFQQVVTSLQMTNCNKSDFNNDLGFSVYNLVYDHKFEDHKFMKRKA